MGLIEALLIQKEEDVHAVQELNDKQENLHAERGIREADGVVDEIANVTKVGGFLIMPVAVELAVFSTAQVAGVGEGARNPENAHGELEKQLDLDHEQAVEEIAVFDKRHERQEDVVAKVDDGREEAEDDEEDERAPGWTDDRVVLVVVVDDEDADDSSGERE